MKKIFYKIFLIFQLLSFCLGNNLNSLNDNSEYLNLDFWQGFQDEILINNLQKAMQNNLDLQIAALKVKESEKIVKLSLSQELPQIDFAPLIGQTFASSDMLRGSNNFMIHSYNQARFLLPVYVSYEVDIWGKNRLKTKSKTQSLKMIEQDEKATYIVFTSAIGADYFNLIKIDKMLELENELLKLSQKLENIIINKEKNGLASRVDILAAKENTVKIRAKINDLETRKETLENQLSYLLGDKLFSAVERNNFDSVVVPCNPPKELDSAIILNRPDVISKSENIIRANFDARIAKKDLLPSFTITGTFGFNGYNNLKGIFANHTGLAEVFVMPQFNIFDGGKKYHFMKLKQIELDEAKKDYEKTVLASLQEVNDSLAILKNENRNYELSNYILDIQNKKLKLKYNNKIHGLSSEADYTLYKISQIMACEKMVNDKINLVISSINLYKAIGGYNYHKDLL